MSSFTANAMAYNVTTENELAEVLSHYNSDFVFSVVDDAMKKRFQSVPIIAMPNVVAAWEQNFKAIIAQYGESATGEVSRVRDETYREIIDSICKEFSLNFTVDDTVDLYSAAFHLYNFLVSGFIDNMTSFFANYIYRERSDIYEALRLGDNKKNKDSSTIYSKKVFKDSKLALINANIDMVIQHVCSMDLPFYIIVQNIFGFNSEMFKYYTTIVSSASNDFFNSVYIPVLNSDIRPEVITGIRLKIHEFAKIHEPAEQTEGTDDI